MYENEGGALPKGAVNSKIATGCTQSEFAQRSTRSTRPRRKIIKGPTLQIEELQETWNNAVDYRIPPKSNAPIAIPAGKSAWFIAVGDEFENLRKDQKSSKTRATTSRQSLAMVLGRMAVAVPNMDLLNDNECTTRLKNCCKKIVKKSTNVFHSSILLERWNNDRHWMDTGAQNAS